MNLFEEGQFAISLLLQLVDVSLLMFVIFSLSVARGGGEAGLAPTLHLSQVSLVLGAPRRERARSRGWTHKNKSMTVNHHTARRSCWRFRWQRKRDIQHRSAELYSLNYWIRGSLVNTVCVFFKGGGLSLGEGWIFFFCQTFCPKSFSECDSLLCLQYACRCKSSHKCIGLQTGSDCPASACAANVLLSIISLVFVVSFNPGKSQRRSCQESSLTSC